MVRKNRRNFLPAFIINVILWVLLFLILFQLSPDKKTRLVIAHYQLLIPINIIFFFTVFTLFLTLTLALLFGNTRRGFLLTLGVNSLLILQLIKQVNVLNLVLIVAITVVLDLLFSVKNKASNKAHTG
jgi:hypothetical protein